jgi:gliding motility-associated-like protein
VQFAITPPKFDLGDDEIICKVPGKKLEVYSSSTDDFEFEWQDGSTERSFTPNGYGTFSVTVRSACGVASDAITYRKFEEPVIVPNVITPNNDKLNETFIITSSPEANDLTVFNRWGQAIYQDPDYQNDWAGNEAASGVYYYRLYNECVGEKIGTVTIMK